MLIKTVDMKKKSLPDFEAILKSVHRPKGNDGWAIMLRRKWEHIPMYIWELLGKLNLENEIILHQILSALSQSCKREEAEKEIERITNNIYPSFIEDIISYEPPCL